MQFVVVSLMGCVLGCNVGMLMRTKVALAWNAVAGCIGANLGSVCFERVSVRDHLAGAFDPMALGAACLGSVVVLAIYNTLRWRP